MGRPGRHPHPQAYTHTPQATLAHIQRPRALYLINIVRARACAGERGASGLGGMGEAARLVAGARAARLSDVTQEGVPCGVGVDPLDRVP